MTTPAPLKTIQAHANPKYVLNTCFRHLQCRDHRERLAFVRFVWHKLWQLDDGASCDWIEVFVGMFSSLHVNDRAAEDPIRITRSKTYRLLDLLLDDSLSPLALCSGLEELYHDTDLSEADWVDHFDALTRTPGTGICAVSNISLQREIEQSLHPLRDFVYAVHLTSQAFFVAQRWANTMAVEQACDRLMDMIVAHERSGCDPNPLANESGSERRDQTTRGVLAFILRAHYAAHFHVSVDALYMSNSLLGFVMNQVSFTQSLVTATEVDSGRYPDLASLVSSETGFVGLAGSADELREVQLRVIPAIISFHLDEVVDDELED